MNAALPARHECDQVKPAALPVGFRAALALTPAAVVATIGAGAPHDPLPCLNAAEAVNVLAGREAILEWLAAVRIHRNLGQVAWHEIVQLLRRLSFLQLVERQR